MSQRILPVYQCSTVRSCLPSTQQHCTVMTEYLKNKVSILFDDGEKLTFLEIKNKLDLECAEIGNFYVFATLFHMHAELSHYRFRRFLKFRTKTKQHCTVHFLIYNSKQFRMSTLRVSIKCIRRCLTSSYFFLNNISFNPKLEMKEANTPSEVHIQ